MSQKELLNRNEVPAEATWDTSTIFKSDEEFEVAYQKAEALLPQASEFQSRLAESSDTLLKAFGISQSTRDQRRASVCLFPPAE